MPKNKQTLRVKAQEYGEQQLEALGFPSRMEFELDDGSVVELLHPWLWSDDTEAAVRAASDAGDEPYNVRLARAALGKTEHARFVAGGGKSTQITLAIEMMKRRDEVEDDPKGRTPKRS